MRQGLIFIFCVALCDWASLAQQPAKTIPITKISLPDPAYIGMPIWMNAESPTGRQIHYPSSTTPNDFDCYEVAIKRDGQLIPPRSGLPEGARTGAACGWLGVADIADSKLPIHLQYPLTHPSTYMVRFTRREYQPGRGMQIAEQSEWTPLYLNAAPPAVLQTWLTSELGMVNGASPGRLVGEVFPSLLASDDSRVLRAMIEASYDENSIVAEYAANSLTLFRAERVRSEVLPILQEQGPNDALGWLFSFDAELVRPIAPQVVADSRPYLRSQEPAKVEAAVHVLLTLRDARFGLPGDTVTEINEALEDSTDFIISQRNDKAAWWIANFLGQARPPNGRELLWKLVNAGLSTEQSLGCITWFHDLADLPRLTDIAKQYDSSDPYGNKHSSLVGELQTEYGTAALPYLRDILSSSKQVWVRTAAAKDLALMNDREGWEFFIGVLKQRPFYHDEMVRWLQDTFPAVRGADEATIMTFLESKLETTTTKQDWR